MSNHKPTTAIERARWKFLLRNGEADGMSPENALRLLYDMERMDQQSQAQAMPAPVDVWLWRFANGSGHWRASECDRNKDSDAKGTECVGSYKIVPGMMSLDELARYNDYIGHDVHSDLWYTYRPGQRIKHARYQTAIEAQWAATCLSKGSRVSSMLKGKDIARRRRLAHERSILQTVSNMISVIPEGEEMKEELRKWKDSVFLELPESNQHQWRQVAVILERLMPFCNLSGWQRLVMMEWNGDQAVPPLRKAEGGEA